MPGTKDPWPSRDSTAHVESTSIFAAETKPFDAVAGVMLQGRKVVGVSKDAYPALGNTPMVRPRQQWRRAQPGKRAWPVDCGYPRPLWYSPSTLKLWLCDGPGTAGSTCARHSVKLIETDRRR